MDDFFGSTINPSPGECCCEDAILKDWPFKHYDKDKDRLFTTWDDFGYRVYADVDGEETRIFIHDHLGVTESYLHPIIPDSKRAKYERLMREGTLIRECRRDNSVLPAIKSLLMLSK